MASTDAKPVPQKNVAYRAVFPILDADGDLVTGAAGLDSEVSKDQGTFTDCTSEATEIATSSGMYYLDLTATEMNADCVAIIVKTSTSGAKTTVLVFYPEETGDIRTNPTAWNGTAVSTPATAGIPEVNIKNVNNVAASSVTAVNANLGTTQPVNFTGTGASALAKSDVVDIAGAAVSASTAQLGVNVVNFGGSAGTFASGRPEVNTTHIAGTISAGTAGYTGIDWGHITAPTTVVALSGTTISAVSGNVGGNVTGSIGSLATQAKADVNAEADTALTDYGALKPTVASRTLDVSATGEAGIDWANVGSPTTTLNLSGTTIAAVSGAVGSVTGSVGSLSGIAFPTNFSALGISAAGKISEVVLVDTLTTYTGDTPQTGDSFARLGAPAGVSVSADIAAVKTDTGNLVTRITSTLFSGITSLGKWLGVLAGKTADSGTLAEVNAMTGGASFNNATDSLEAVRDRGDSAWTTGIGGGGSVTVNIESTEIRA